MITPNVIHKRYCLILELLKMGDYVTWTRRRLGRIIHFLLDRHPGISVQYSDWRLQAFGWYSGMMHQDVRSLDRIGLVSLDWPRDFEIVSLTVSGDYHIPRVATRTLGTTVTELLERVVPQFIYQNAYRPRSDYVDRRVFRTIDPQNQVGELRKQDVIEDSEFGVGYLVVSGVWIPVEAVRANEKGIVEIREDL